LPTIEEQRTKQLKQSGYSQEQINELLKYEAAMKALETYSYNLSFTNIPPPDETTAPNHQNNNQTLKEIGKYSPSKDVDSENEKNEKKEKKEKSKNHQEYQKQIHHHHRDHSAKELDEESKEEAVDKPVSREIKSKQESGEPGKWETVEKSVFPESASENDDDDDDDDEDDGHKPKKDLSDFVSNNQLHQKHFQIKTKEKKRDDDDDDSENSEGEVIYEKKPISLSVNNNDDDDDDDEEDEEKPKQITFKKRKRIGGPNSSSKVAKHDE